MTAAVLTKAASASRLLADVEAVSGHDPCSSEPALSRLEAVIGRDLADRLVAALSTSQRP
ncbi:MAG: hypothetical protein R6W48_04250 [Gaiellaceae bacterium]